MQTTALYDRLCAAARAEGCRLFTVTVCNAQNTLHARAFTSHPVEYPVSGTKPMDRDAWFDHVITGLNSFIANSPAEFETLFFDHALITSMGLGSALNIPIIEKSPGQPAKVLGTVNILAEAGHFTPEKLDAYHAMTMAVHDDLADAMRGYGQKAAAIRS
jgi:hypothetical protein